MVVTAVCYFSTLGDTTGWETWHVPLMILMVSEHDIVFGAFVFSDSVASCRPAAGCFQSSCTVGVSNEQQQHWQITWRKNTVCSDQPLVGSLEMKWNTCNLLTLFTNLVWSYTPVVPPVLKPPPWGGWAKCRRVCWVLVTSVTARSSFVERGSVGGATLLGKVFGVGWSVLKSEDVSKWCDVCFHGFGIFLVIGG